MTHVSRNQEDVSLSSDYKIEVCHTLVDRPKKIYISGGGNRVVSPNTFGKNTQILVNNHTFKGSAYNLAC